MLMERIFPLLGLVLMAVVFWICAVAIKKSEKRAKEESVRGTGTVVDYVRSSRNGRQWRKPKTIHRIKLWEGESEEGYTAPPKRVGGPSIVPTRYPLMSVTIDGETVQCVASCGRYCTPGRFPIGTALTVLYRKKTLPVMGDVYDIRIDEDGLRPMSLTPAVVIFQAVSLVLLAAAIVVAAI